jgi:hypothetical protein
MLPGQRCFIRRISAITDDDVSNKDAVDAAGMQSSPARLPLCHLQQPAPSAAFARMATGGSFDAFAAPKLKAAGSALVYSTYLGGSGTTGARLAVDSADAHYRNDLLDEFSVTAGALSANLLRRICPEAQCRRRRCLLDIQGGIRATEPDGIAVDSAEMCIAGTTASHRYRNG